MIIALAGVNGAGKTTVARRLATTLRARGHRVHERHLAHYALLRPAAAVARRLLGAPSKTGQVLAVAPTRLGIAAGWLVLADAMLRYYVELRLLSRLGGVVVCDRFFHDRAIVDELAGFASPGMWRRYMAWGLRPDLGFVLQIAPQVAADRSSEAAARRVHTECLIARYAALARGGDWHAVDGSRDPEAVFATIWSRVTDSLDG